MKLADTNILVYAADVDSAHHATSREWLENTLNTPTGLGLAWLAVVGFVRLTTHPRISAKPRTVAQALGYVDDWLAHPNTHIVQPGERHADLLARLLLSVGTAGNLTNDAHLAAIAIEHNVEMVSFDRDFQRFPGLKFHLLA